MLALTLTDERCSSCGSYTWAAPAPVDALLDELRGCPECDRPRCTNCRHPFGLLFGQDRRRALRLDQKEQLCELCEDAPATEMERTR